MFKIYFYSTWTVQDKNELDTKGTVKQWGDATGQK